MIPEEKDIQIIDGESTVHLLEERPTVSGIRHIKTYPILLTWPELKSM